MDGSELLPTSKIIIHECRVFNILLLPNHVPPTNILEHTQQVACVSVVEKHSLAMSMNDIFPILYQIQEFWTFST